MDKIILNTAISTQNFRITDYIKYQIEKNNLKKYIELDEDAKEDAKYDIIYYEKHNDYIDMFMDSYLSDIEYFLLEFSQNIPIDPDLLEIISDQVGKEEIEYYPNTIGSYLQGFIEIINTDKRSCNYFSFKSFKEILERFIEILEIDQDPDLNLDAPRDPKIELSLKDISYYISTSKVDIKEAIKEYEIISDKDLEILYNTSIFETISEDIEDLENKEVENLLDLIHYMQYYIEKVIDNLDYLFKSLIEGDLDNLDYSFDEDEVEYINNDFYFSPKGDLILNLDTFYYGIESELMKV